MFYYKTSCSTYIDRQSLKQRKYKKPPERHGHHKCTFCMKRFLKPSQLQRHLRIHTGERPYHCNVCKKTFNQKGALQLHLKTHDELRPFKCEHCPMRFAQKGNLRAHVAVSISISYGCSLFLMSATSALLTYISCDEEDSMVAEDSYVFYYTCLSARVVFRKDTLLTPLFILHTENS